jgi:hypothetical protein
MKETTNIPFSTSGYSCPNCGAVCSDKTLLKQTKPEFCDEPEYHYEWIETHKCSKCETIYKLNKAT